MTGTSNNLRKLRAASTHYNNNVTKRGLAPAKAKEVEDKPSIPPYVMYFIFFVLVGSSVLQIVNSMKSSPF